MDIVYIITDNKTSRKYIGSKKKWKGPNTYFGSPGCSIEHPKYKIQQDWINDTKIRPDDFILTIIESFDEIDQNTLLEKEKYWQKSYDAVKSIEFINAGYVGTSTWYGGYSFKGKTYEEIYGDKADTEKEKRKEKLRGKRSQEVCKNISESLKGNIPWNKGLTKEDPRVLSYTIKKERLPYKTYKLEYDGSYIEIKGKQNLIEFISNINKDLNLKSRINLDKLLAFGENKNLKLKT